MSSEYKRLTDVLADSWELPIHELTPEQKYAWTQAFGLIGEVEEVPVTETAAVIGPQEPAVLFQRWTGPLFPWASLVPSQRKQLAEQYDQEHDPALDGVRKLAFYNYAMNASIWMKLADVKPDEAAKLLCRINPLSKIDPERLYVDDDKASPDRYRLLLRVFLSVAETEPRPRSLLGWRDEAKRAGLRYHEWIDEYVQAQIEELPADADSNVGVAKAGGGGAAKKNTWTDVALKTLWEESILPGMTQKKLAEKYGVTHQSISKQLKKAKERFSKTKRGASKQADTWLS